MIDVAHLSKSYGPVLALDEVTFRVKAGEVIGLLGPNGAGKTTMMKILTGFLQPSGGTALVDGLDVVSQALEVQRRIGYLPENAPLYPELSVQGYLRMVARLREIPEKDQPRRIAEAVRATGLVDMLARPIAQLSKGFRQRVGLAQAILHQPKLLILDEPTIGLDPTQIVEVRHLIRRLAQHSTVLLSTHILSEVEALCDRVIILLNGQVRADSRLADLEAGGDFVLVLGDSGPDASPVLRSAYGVRSVETGRTADGVNYRVRSREGLDLRPALFELARDKGWALRELRRETRTLESVFNELVTTGAEASRESGERRAA